MRSPRILIDALGIDQPGGPRTATLNLLYALFEARPGWQFRVYLSRREEVFERFSNVQQVIFPVRKGAAARLLFQLVLPLDLLFRPVDLIHFAKSQAAWIRGPKKVFSMFDITTLQLAGYHSPLAVWYWRSIQPALARSCQAVVTLSYTAARDLETYLGQGHPPIHVVYLASQLASPFYGHPKPYEAVQGRYHLPPKYLLFVGVLALKKNLPVLIRALDNLKQRCIPFPPLILAGPHYPQSEDRLIFDLIRQLGLEQDVRHIGKVDVSELPALYQGADLFLMPSINEGFGIPCIEAMQFGAPVVASNATALPEVVGEAGVLVDDFNNPRAWADQIAGLLADAEQRESLRQAGYIRAREFSWENSALQLAKIYQILLGLDA